MNNLVDLRCDIDNREWLWPKDDVNCWINLNNFKKLHENVMPYVKDKNIMVQAGGNCGLILDTFTNYFNNIYTFEPDPINFYCLNHNVTSDKVTKIQSCIGNSNNPLKIQHLVRDDYPKDIGGVQINGIGLTPCFKIDQLNLPDCNLIQLDVEGYEVDAILGAKNTIEKYKPVLCIEFCDKWLKRYNNNVSKLSQLLKKLNYKEVDSYGVDKIFIYDSSSL